MDVILVFGVSKSSDSLVLVGVNDKTLMFLKWKNPRLPLSCELFVFQVATWEKQIYTCCRDGLVRRYQLSDLWSLAKRSPSKWKGLTLINSEQNIIRDHGTTMSDLCCIGYPSETIESQLLWPMWSYHSMTRPTLNWGRSSHVLAAFVPTSPLNSAQHIEQGNGCL